MRHPYPSPLWLSLFCLVLLLAGCFGPEVRMPDLSNLPQSHANDPIALALQRIAIAATVAGSAGVFIAVLIAIFVKDIPLACKVGTASIAGIIAAAILYWLGSHLALAVGGVVIVGLLAALVWVWIHRRWVVGEAEELTGRDLDHDGTVGIKPPTPSQAHG